MTDDFLPLASSRWCLWRGIVLRGAGFAVSHVERLAAPALAEAVDTTATTPCPTRSGGKASGAGAADDFEREIDRLAVVIDNFADEPQFREAIVWQNPGFLETCLDRRPSSGRRDNRSRRRETAIATYLQRYATKNDSIGFFGPVGWATWAPEVAHSSCTPGPALVNRRTVYFESWAIDAVAAAFARRPELRHGVPPRWVPANVLRHGHVVRPYGKPIPVTEADVAIIRLCDGERPVREIASALRSDESALLERLDELCRLDVLRMDLGGPIEAFPERRLRERLGRIPDPGAGQRALTDLDRLTELRNEVAEAAGNPGLLAVRMKALQHAFEDLASVAPTRMHGQTYAGRTLVYEDTVRDADVVLGEDVYSALEEPLALILDAGRWLVARIGELYVQRLTEYYERKRARTGSDWIPLSALLALATRDFYTGAGQPDLASVATAELQRKWANVLDIPLHARRYDVTPQEIADRIRTEFDSPSPSWSSGLHHSPDLMIAARSLDAIREGDFLLVLGELHLAFNTVESRALVEQSLDKPRLLRMAERAGGKGRMVPVAPRAWGAVTGRTSPPTALLSPEFSYWAVDADDVADIPGSVIPLSQMEVGRRSDGLVVRTGIDGTYLGLHDVLGDYISRVAINAFRMLPRTPHAPRVTIGRLVVARETWRIPVRKCDWANQLDERRRYVQMREWVRRLGLPRRVFCSVQVETKPTFVDFTSVPLTNALAGVIRRLAREAPECDVVLSEMLPGVGDTWLTDSDGFSYTSELRMVATESV